MRTPLRVHPSISFVVDPVTRSGHRLVSQLTGSADSSVDSVDVLTLVLTVGLWFCSPQLDSGSAGPKVGSGRMPTVANQATS